MKTAEKYGDGLASVHNVLNIHSRSYSTLSSKQTDDEEDRRQGLDSLYNSIIK